MSADNDQDEGAHVYPRNVYLNFVQRYCLGKTRLKSFNEWICSTIYDNITSAEAILPSGHKVKCCNLEVSKPSYRKQEVNYPLTPAYAKQQLLTYAVNLRAEMIIETLFGDVLYTRKDVDIGYVPVMIKSKMCTLYGMNAEQLVACGEDPTDIGGYFIINSSEYVIMYLEKLDMNKFIMFVNKKEKGDVDVSITTLNKNRKTSVHPVFYSVPSR